jgi:DNA-binding transcriptional LysR family regulator
VVEADGFTAAARRAGDSQSAISKTIGALERRLGVLLFNRSTRSVTLTDQRQRYYGRAKLLLDEMDGADSQLTSSTHDVSGLIRVAVSGTFDRLHVLPLIPDLLSLNSGLQVDLILSDFVRDRVADGIDLAIRGACQQSRRDRQTRGQHSPRMRWIPSLLRATRNAKDPPPSSLITIAFYIAA